MHLFFDAFLIASSLHLILLLDCARIPKASKKQLEHVKKLLNDQVESHNNQIQNDGFDLFQTMHRDPHAKLHHDELSVNNIDEYFQGDMDLSEQQIKIIEDQFVEGKREKRKIGKTPLYKKWDTSIPISFDFSDSIPPKTRQKIREAMILWQRNTCIRFQEGGPNVNRLEFFDGGGCSSFVGKVGGTQGISISTPGCDVVGIISHEIGHSLGIFHEQARPDQERHIAINYNNIPLARWNNFQAVDDNHADTFDLPYDTGSVMHYGPYGFASDPYTPTIRTLEKAQQSTIGQRAGPSFLDYQAINVAYDCVSRCGPLPCLRGGYPNPNDCSSCLCPEGLSGQFCEKVYPSTEQCGGTLFANKEIKYISSPNYPNEFPLNTECNWIIVAPAEGRVFMEFEGDFDFLCEDTCDKAYVEVKYHNDKRLTGARYCCSLTPRNKFISFTNEMIIIMKGFNYTSIGFNAKYWSNLGEPEPERKIETTSTSSTTSTTTTTTTVLPPRPIKKVKHLVKPTTRAPVATTTTTVPPTTVPTTTEAATSTPAPVTLTTPVTLFPTLAPIIPILASTQAPDVINSVLECGCGSWSEWQGECSQQCGGCGQHTRTRTCEKESCRKEEKRHCNFATCPEGTNFLINNSEFHILWRGCCVGLFRSGDQCTALETEQNPFFKIINSLLSIQDAKNNSTMIAKRLMRGEH
ncbi:unnamed protein product [Caenorhabditis angaria]|uniref:Zinc metalloproteinase n=1 Tax=Caenorhabditis angaria TaxID=860376 RepID=A0A9P1J6P5_9PELO|nr:unnamed protein product [Caenorhabditis angaria]